MLKRIFFVGRWSTQFALAALAIMASAKPEDAMSNLAGWWAYLLPTAAPRWLQGTATDRTVFWCALAGLVAINLWPHVRRHLGYLQKDSNESPQEHPVLPQQYNIRRDISWGFDDLSAKGADFILSMVQGSEGEPRIFCFQASGHNNMSVPIRNVSGFIHSNITNEEYKIYFVIAGQKIPPTETYGVPSGADFMIASDDFSPSDENGRNGLPLSRFWTEFGTFTFVFDYDGRRYTKHFSADEIARTVARFQEAAGPQRDAGPRVVRKPNLS